MRTTGGWLWTAATVAIRFLLAYSPLPLRTTRSARSGLTIGMPLQSIAPTRISPSCGSIASPVRGVEALEIGCCVADSLLG
ncbi:MAG: hypothetical protein ACLP01_18755 [Solirubrobacteraceae bacterium]